MIDSLKIYIKECIIIFLRLFIRPKKSIVMFSGFRGEYSDNPKYIAEKLHELSKEIEIYWALGSPNECINIKDIPEYVHVMYTNTFDYFCTVNRAAVLIDNYYGFFLSEHPTRHDWRMKNKRQYNISTWHGTPLKCIGADAKDTTFENVIFSSSDLVIAGCQYTKEKLYSAYISHFNEPVDIMLIGTPRNDILFKTSQQKQKEIKTKLGLPLDKKIVLFAPTFRGDIDNSGIRQLEEINVQMLLNELSSKLFGDWVFVFRVHHEVAQNSRMRDIVTKYTNIVFDGNQYSDMAEYLSVCDCLITDYSGSLFDFALTKKPCFLYALDLENYANNERGLYLDIKELPYSFSNNFNELIDNIRSYNQELAEKNIVEFLEYIGNVETGQASEIVVDLIMERLKK